MFEVKDIIRNLFALFFPLFMHSQMIYFYHNYNVRLFKLVKAFILSANSLAPLTPILLSLNILYKIYNVAVYFEIYAINVF